MQILKGRGGNMAGNALMTEVAPDVLKRLQETQIEILEEIVRICDKYHLRYFLTYGTLIGAIRHRGFIPWDDDLDIGMPRDDFEKFTQVAKSELKEEYYLQNTDTESEYWQPFAKIRKNGTLFEEASISGMSDNIHKGIFVDIFPFDYVKKNNGLFVHMQSILVRAINETMYFKAGVFEKKEKLRYKKLDMFLKCFSMKTLCNMQRKIASIQNQTKSKYLADFNSSRHYLAAIFPLALFMPLQDGEFAGRKFKIPKEYDTYLRIIYGDYMKLPREEERVNHRTLRIVFDTAEENSGF